ncbi:FCD domain-containing protein, partial [Aromatoleum toluclasticum]
ILYQQSERYRRISLFRQPIPRDIHAEHQALVDATLARDATRATSILSEHILRTLDAVKQMPQDFFARGKRP